MEPEGSLPPSQVPATCPHPKPDQSSPLHLTSWRYILILSPNIYPGIQSDIVPPDQIPVSTSPLPPSTCHISVFMTWSAE